MLKRLYLLLIAILLAWNPVFAEDPLNKKAGDYIDNIAQNIIGILENEKNTENDKESKITKIFLDTMNIDWMGRFVLSTNWRSMSDSTKSRFLDVYKDYLVSIYVPRFKRYNDQTYKIVNSTSLKRQHFIVSMDMYKAHGSQPLRIDYRLRYRNNSFEIIDIKAEGVSLIATQRSDFNSVINSGGIEKLIKLLGEKAETYRKTGGPEEEVPKGM
jgi:phospholipid transport system substrate-binding protein